MFVRRKVLFLLRYFFSKRLFTKGHTRVQDQMAFENLQEVKLTKKKLVRLTIEGRRILK